MRWECAECGRVHDRDPGVCVCGSADQRQRSAPGEAGWRERTRIMLFDPAQRQLMPDGPIVSVAFRVIVAVVLVSFAVAVAILLL